MVSLQKLGRVYVLTILGDGEHRLNDNSMGKIIEALETVQEDPDVGALVTTNEGKFYSNGLDLKYVESARARARTKAAPSNAFGRLLATMFAMNVPTIAAICGHAAAGGYIFALAHDHRFMRKDRGFLYMSEMDVKVRISVGVLNLIKLKMSPKAFKDTCLLAKKQTASEAFELGIVDYVHENAGATLQAAIAFATELSRKNWDRNFYRNYRLDMKPGLLDELLDEVMKWIVSKKRTDENHASRTENTVQKC
ncbi:hypothetical protein R1sor_019540 [Riccia sorocarpa]|uniref:Delta(3)-Delta(2)-enoyl-CoA isomerase n=1 Tax=Riccia sorocarpa TaxID=122646 RepID=A0ABD3ICT6_9MARC